MQITAESEHNRKESNRCESGCPLLWRNAGTYPGYVFTWEPVKLPAGHFGLGHDSGTHAPDEYYIIESANPKIQGFDGAVMSFIEYVYELAK